MILGSGTVEREAIGVVAGITGYNFPFLLNLAKVFPALLAGNTLVLKPSPFTPYSALLFGQIAEEVGLPKGVLNIITGGVDVGSLLSSDPRVDMVSFTGSEAVGVSIMSQAAPTLKRVHLELGGKSALIVRADADIQATALGAVAGLAVNAGQGCALLTRFVVHHSVREQFVQCAKAIAGQWKVGNPADPSVMMGPLIRESQRAKVEHFIASGRDAGATLVCGGGRPADLRQGFFSDITLFDDVRNDMLIAQEEIFGPVGVVIGFDSDDEAVCHRQRFALWPQRRRGLGRCRHGLRPGQAHSCGQRVPQWRQRQPALCTDWRLQALGAGPRVRAELAQRVHPGKIHHLSHRALAAAPCARGADTTTDNKNKRWFA
jgi:aldehyde dehydrogenase (NAD+)